MVGTISLNIKCPKLEFDLILRRRITILRGNSGTGKSVLHSLVTLSETSNKVNIKCKYNVVAINNLYGIDSSLRALSGSVVIVDENSPLLLNDEFKNKILKYDIWFILICRGDRYLSIPFSHKEVYEIVDIDSKCKVNKPYYEEPRFDDLTYRNSVTAASFDCMSKFISSLGLKTNEYTSYDNLIRGLAIGNYDNSILVINSADSGRYYGIINAFVKSNIISIKSIECMEALLLNLSYFKTKKNSSLITEPEKNVVSTYPTWKDYFEQLLDSFLIQYFGIPYVKDNICHCYSRNCNFNHKYNLQCIFEQGKDELTYLLGLTELIDSQSKDIAKMAIV